jgi:hypothetical protein
MPLTVTGFVLVLSLGVFATVLTVWMAPRAGGRGRAVSGNVRTARTSLRRARHVNKARLRDRRFFSGR